MRRGRTLAGPLWGLCHIGAHPHPPRMCSAPSPLEGEGLRAADSRPYGERGDGCIFLVGAGPRPARGRGTPQGGFISAQEPPLCGGWPRNAPAGAILPFRGNSHSAPTLRISRKALLAWVGEALGPPADDGPATTCSAKPGAEGKTHRPQFWENQGPVARNKTQETTQILCAGNIAIPDRYASPVMGVLGGRAAWRQGRRSRFCRLRPPPSGSLVTFWSSRKSLAAGAAKLPNDKRKNSIIAPSSAPFGGTFPQGEGFKKGGRRNSLVIKRDPASPRPPRPAWTARHSCSASL